MSGIAAQWLFIDFGCAERLQNETSRYWSYRTVLLFHVIGGEYFSLTTDVAWGMSRLVV